MFSTFQINSSSSRANTTTSARTATAPPSGGALMTFNNTPASANATAGASSSVASSSAVVVDPLRSVKAALATQDMNNILSVGDFNIWERDMQKTTGLERPTRGNVCKQISKLLRQIYKNYEIQCQDTDIENAMTAGIASALEMGTVVCVQRIDPSLDPKSRFDTPKIELLYNNFQLAMKKELRSVKLSKSDGAKPSHADDFLAIVRTWKDKAHEKSNAPLFATPSNAALPASAPAPAPAAVAPPARMLPAAPASAPTPAPLARNIVRGPSNLNMVAPTNSSFASILAEAQKGSSSSAPASTPAPLPRNTVQGPAVINMVPLANSSAVNTLTGLGASSYATTAAAPAPSFTDDASMEVDSSPQARDNIAGTSISHGTAAPAPVTVLADDSNVGDSMEIDSYLPLRRSPSPETLLIDEDLRQFSMRLILKEVEIRNAEAAQRHLERLTPAEIPECAQMMEHNVLNAMKADIRIESGEFKQQEIEGEYQNLVNTKLHDCSILAKFVKKVKQFHRHVKNGIVKLRGGTPLKKYHGATSAPPSPQPSPPPPPPAQPSMDPLRAQFKELFHKALMETGEKLLNSEHLPHLNLTKAEVDDLVKQLEAEMYGNLEKNHGHENLGFDGSCEKYVEKGEQYLKQIRDRGVFVQTVEEYKKRIG